MNVGTALNIISRNVVATREKHDRMGVQRRNAVVDQYGYEFHRQGDKDNPAEIGISISPDLIYFERFEWKLILSPFKYHDGKKLQTIPSNTRNLTIKIDGIDLTPYFKAQYNGLWIGGSGVYPNADLGTYDVLRAVSLMDKAEQEKVLKPGYKKVTVTADGPFDITLVNYLKYSHVNR